MTINFLLSSQLLIMPGISHLFQNFYYSVLTLDTIWNLGQMFLQRKKKKKRWCSICTLIYHGHNILVVIEWAGKVWISFTKNKFKLLPFHQPSFLFWTKTANYQTWCERTYRKKVYFCVFICQSYDNFGIYF